MPEIISKPGREENSSGINKELHFGYFETQNSRWRPSQEDALAWHTLTQQDLTPTGTTSTLTPVEIGHRLWTSYQVLDKLALSSGTTASTTVYDGKGNLITATLADAAAFAAVYDKKRGVLGVIRLNSVTHKPTNDNEKERIRAARGFVVNNRVNGILAVSRAIGDHFLKKAGVCSEATIDITNFDKIANDLNIDPNFIGSIQIISTCDGFTDGAGIDQSKKSHENYLFNILKQIKTPDTLPEDKLAQALAQQSVQDDSKDNVSVAIQTLDIFVEKNKLTSKTSPMLLGMYDGHDGKEASCLVADNIGSEFKKQCTLTPEAYAQQELSMNTKKTNYMRDNVDSVQEPSIKIKPEVTPEPVRKPSLDGKIELAAVVSELLTRTSNYQTSLLKPNRSPELAQISPIISNLIKLLKSKKSNEDKIKDFYRYLDKTHQGTANEPPLKNIDIIKKDTSKSALNFLLGIAIIAATVVTGVLPGLLVIGIVYTATGRHPGDLLKSEGQRFEKEVELIKAKPEFKSGFFKPETKIKQDDDKGLEEGEENLPKL